MASSKHTKNIIYPPGVKEIKHDLSKDELVRRLKALATVLQEVPQEGERCQYADLACFLGEDFFIKHSNKDVRVVIACCLADLFRIFAPDEPLKEPEKIKGIFLFFGKQLRGLEDVNNSNFKRYFYLLENLAWVKTFNVCMELEDNQEIFVKLFQTMFSIIHDGHSVKVRSDILDLLSTIITEADTVSQDLLDSILINIIEPQKTENQNAYQLSVDILKKTTLIIKAYIQTFFNGIFILGKTSTSDLADHMYELIYELHQISPNILLAVLPQLEFKLKSSEEQERVNVTRLLAKMFSDKDSELASENKSLWQCFLGRFNDINVAVRTECVRFAAKFLLNHPAMSADLQDRLRERQHDVEETVRHEVVLALATVAKKNLAILNDDMLNNIKERMLDKKWKVRKESTLAVAHIYKKYMNSTTQLDHATLERVRWMKNKLMHMYYQENIDDRILVERIFSTSIVPFNLPPEERMKRLFQLYATLDEYSVRAVNEMFKSQCTIRAQVNALTQIHNQYTVQTDEVFKAMTSKLITIARTLPEPVKAQDYLKKFNEMLAEDKTLLSNVESLVNPDCTCSRAETSVKSIVNKLGNPKLHTPFLETARTLLERIAPLLIDNEAIQALLQLIDKYVNQVEDDDIDDVAEEGAVSRGLKLLLMLSGVYPGGFKTQNCYEQLITFLRHDNEELVSIALQIFINIGKGIEESHSDVAICLIPILQTKAKSVSSKQAKHAIRCINVISKNRLALFNQIFEQIKRDLDFDSENLLGCLTALGHIGNLCPQTFSPKLKPLVTKFVVKGLLMNDRETGKNRSGPWCTMAQLSHEIQSKIRGIKLIALWLLGMKNTQSSVAKSTFKMLSTLIVNRGDLMEKKRISPCDMAHMRLIAGCSILKLVQQQCYHEVITTDQIQTVALLINDECAEVRKLFTLKLHRGLVSMKLPLEFLAMLSLCAKEPMKEMRALSKQLILKNFNVRREFLKQNPAAPGKLQTILPDYVIPHCIYLLAHSGSLTCTDDLPALRETRECLWFLIESLVTKNDDYNYSFIRKLIESIKQCKDAQNPDDDVLNKKLYVVCDLALSLISAKNPSYNVLKFPTDPVLPANLYTVIDKDVDPSKNFLPKGFDPSLPGNKSKQRDAIVSSPPSVDGSAAVNVDNLQHELSNPSKRSRNTSSDSQSGRKRNMSSESDEAQMKRQRVDQKENIGATSNKTNRALKQTKIEDSLSIGNKGKQSTTATKKLIASSVTDPTTSSSRADQPVAHSKRKPPIGRKSPEENTRQRRTTRNSAKLKHYSESSGDELLSEEDEDVAEEDEENNVIPSTTSTPQTRVPTKAQLKSPPEPTQRRNVRNREQLSDGEENTPQTNSSPPTPSYRRSTRSSATVTPTLDIAVVNNENLQLNVKRRMNRSRRT